MTSRLLAELDAQARSATNLVVWARAICKTAVYLARQGDLVESHDHIRRVRAAFGVELHPEVASWVMLAEGVQHFLGGDFKMSYDRLQRAYGLAVAFRTHSARPNCAAWMALIEFNTSRYEEMAKHLREALRDATEDDHQTRSRACLVVADAYQLACGYQTARPWYEQTRLHATAEGDQATLSALLYNVAAFRTAALRLADTFGEVSQQELKRASMEATSSLSYDFAVGSKSFGAFGPLLYAQLKIIDLQFEESLKILEAVREGQLFPKDYPILLCDRAWCLARLNRQSEAWEFAEQAIPRLAVIHEHDDLAYATSRLSQVAQICGRQVELEQFANTAQEALGKHRVFQAYLQEKIDWAVEPQGSSN